MAKYFAFVVLAALACSATAFKFEETFSDDWESRWVKSSWKQNEGTAGDFTLTAGKWYGDAEADKGVQTGPDARFFAMSSEMPEVFDNKDKNLVLQFSVKHEQKLDCGGGYIKLSPADIDAASFSGDTKYNIMFGPDICGATKRIHVIFNYKGDNHLIKKTLPCETDEMTHVYTLIVKPDNTYQVLVDNAEKATGSLEDDWDMLPAKMIVDPEDKKPEDWDENPKIADPEDVKPEGYDDIPETIADPEAAKPEDWDDEDDGEWEPRMIPNPEFKGPWSPKMIDNPDYKGKWEPQQIENPEYSPDPTLYHFESKFVGFELWQVKAGSIFDNILVTDDVEYAKEFAEKTWGASKEGEKKMFDEIAAEKAAAEEEERKKADDAKKALEEEEEYEDDEEAEHDEL